jgi:hypothetical protein
VWQYSYAIHMMIKVQHTMNCLRNRSSNSNDPMRNAGTMVGTLLHKYMYCTNFSVLDPDKAACFLSAIGVFGPFSHSTGSFC